MLRHIAMFRWRPGLTDAEKENMLNALRSFGQTMSALGRLHVGVDAGLNAGNYDVVVVGDFGSRDEYLAYRDHPDHRTFIEEYVAPVIADRVAVQYQGGSDRTLDVGP